MKKTILIILSITFFFACTKQSSDLNSEQQSNTNAVQVTRVFKASFFTSIDPDPSNGPLPCSGDIPNFAIPMKLLVHGSATHLGELHWEQSTLVHSSCSTSFPIHVLNIIVSGQLTAANGDKIFYTANDNIDLAGLLSGGHTGTITGTWTITGGTGRFEDASGTFTINGPVDFATLAVSFDAVGTITY